MHQLSPYTVRIHDHLLPGRIEERYHQLDSVRTKDLLDVLWDFLNSKTAAFHAIEDNKRALKFSELMLDRTERAISGFVEAGDYGAGGKVVNIRDGRMVHKKSKDESDINQYYFCFLVPQGKKTGVALFHSMHGRGVKSLFEQLFNEYLPSVVKDLKVQLKPISYEKAVQDWLSQSVVKEIRVRKTTAVLSQDILDKLGGDLTEEKVLKPRRKGATLGSLRDYLKSGAAQGDLRSVVEVLAAENDSVKVQVELAGSRRVFSLNANTVPIGAIEFSDDDVEMDDGVPKFIPLDSFAKKLLADLLPP